MWVDAKYCWLLLLILLVPNIPKQCAWVVVICPSPYHYPVPQLAGCVHHFWILPFLVLQNGSPMGLPIQLFFCGLTWFALVCFGCPSPPETPLGVPGSRVISGAGRPRLVSTHRRYASTGSLPESAAGDAAVRSCHPPPAPPYAPLRKDREWWRVRPTHPCSNEEFYSRAAPLIPTFSASALNWEKSMEDAHSEKRKTTLHQRHYIPLWWMPIEILYISLLGKTAPHTTERNSRQENLNPNFTSLKSESLSLSLYKIIWV